MMKQFCCFRHMLKHESICALLLLVFFQSVSISSVQAQTTTTLVPSSYVTTEGTDGGQPVSSSIDILDESGTTNTWSKYVEFQNLYTGYQVFTLSTSISPSSITAMQVKVNYQGPSTSTQTWTWKIYNWTTGAYTTVGTNAGAPDWGTWKVLTFNISGTFSNYVRRSDGQIRLQLLSNNSADAADIDYEAIVVTYSNTQTAVGVTLSPTSATLNGGGTQQFTAAVTGSSNTAVTWLLTGVGTLSTSGLYTAPATVSSATTATATATSQADTTKSASATVSINTTAVSISTPPATVQVSSAEQFTATVTGNVNTAVTWQVNGVSGGNSTVGTISSSGLYTAPSIVPGPATVTVTAVAQADATKSASATFTITAAPVVSVTISPTSASVQTSGTQQFSATVTNSSNTAVTWEVNRTVGGSSTTGTISTSGLYTAPAAVPSPATVTVTAVSQASSSATASATVTVTAAKSGVAVSVSPTSEMMQTNASQQFTATVTGSSNTAVTWEVNGVVGGNSTTGMVSPWGVYTAPAAVPSPSAVTVTAVSQASTSSLGLATVTVTAASGTTFYVSKSGSDSNSGSQSAPWLTIQHAATTATAGDTVIVEAGTYNESDTFSNSGTVSAPIVFQSQTPGTAILDGTGVPCCNGPDGYATGLFNIGNVNYVTINGFTFQNFTTSSADNTPAGIDIYGYGTGISILNNTVHNITTTSEKEGNAYGISVHGTNATPISGLIVSGNTVYNNKTGNSETVTFNGNVQNFTVTNNLVYDNDNIGIDFIGGEGTAPTGYDSATNGEVSDNVVYGISAINNPGEGNSYDADGLYCDTCTNVTIERNTVYACDLNIEVASEHKDKVASGVIVRNNLVYGALTVGISIGGYSSSVGGTTGAIIVNNSLYDNGTVSDQGDSEFQVQYHTMGNVFENNIVYANSAGLIINNFEVGSGVTANHNVYYTTNSTPSFIWNGTSYSSFASCQSGAGQDANSEFENPDYLTLTTCTGLVCSPAPDLDISTGSPAENTGINLGAADVGIVDFAGNSRVNDNGQINIGAYEQ
jgi:hypothetical protein